MKSEITFGYQNEGVYDRVMLFVDYREQCSMLYKVGKNKDHIYLYDFFNCGDDANVLGCELLVKEIAAGFDKVFIEENFNRNYGSIIRGVLNASVFTTIQYSIEK